MIITVKFLDSVKDAGGNIKTYSAELTKDVQEDGLTPEQVVTKMRAIMHFLHREIHVAVQEDQVKDGVRSAVDHQA